MVKVFLLQYRVPSLHFLLKLLSLKVIIVEDTDENEFSIKMGNEVLSCLLDMPEVLALDEDALAEHLLFLNDVKFTSLATKSSLLHKQYLIQ